MNLSVRLKAITSGFSPRAVHTMSLRSSPEWQALDALVRRWSTQNELALTELTWPLRSLPELVELEERRQRNRSGKQSGTLLEWLVALETCAEREGAEFAGRIAKLVPASHPLLTALALQVLEGLPNELPVGATPLDLATGTGGQEEAQMSASSALGSVPEWLAASIRDRLKEVKTARGVVDSGWGLFGRLWPKADFFALLERALGGRLAIREVLRADFGLVLPAAWLQAIEARLSVLAPVVQSEAQVDALINCLLEPMLRRSSDDTWANISGFLVAIPQKQVLAPCWRALQQWIESQPAHLERLSDGGLAILRQWHGFASYYMFKAILDVWSAEGEHEAEYRAQLQSRSTFWSHYQSRVRGARLCLSSQVKRVLEAHNLTHRGNLSMQVNLASKNISFDVRVVHPYALLVFDKLALRIPFSGDDDLFAIEGDGLQRLLESSFEDLLEAVQLLNRTGRATLGDHRGELTRTWQQDNYYLWQVAVTYRLMDKNSGDARIEPDEWVEHFVGLGRSDENKRTLYQRGVGLRFPSKQALVDLLRSQPNVDNDHLLIGMALKKGKISHREADAAREYGKYRGGRH